MRIKHFVTALSLLLAIGLGYWQCKLPIIEDCSLRVGIKVTPTSDPAVFEFRDSVGTAGPQATYQWVLGDGNLSDKAEFMHTYASGTYEVVLTVSEPGGCTATAQISLPVKTDGPQADFSFKLMPASGEAPCTVRFYNTSKNGETFAWDFGDPASSNNTSTRPDSVDHTYTRAETYMVTLTAKKSGYNDSPKTAEVVVKVPTFPAQKFTVGSNPTVNPETVFGIDEGGNGQFYLAINNGIGCYTVKTDAKGQSPISAYSSLGTSIYINNTMRKVSNGYLLVGEAFFSGGGAAMYVLKTSLSFDSPLNAYLHDQPAGGSEFGYCAAETPNGNYLVGGFCSRSGGKGGAFFAQANPATLGFIAPGTTLWNTDLDANASAILRTTSGYLAAGRKTVSAGVEACFFQMTLGLALSGQVSTWGATTFEIKDILPLDGGLYALVGKDNETLRIRVVNASGNSIWDMPYSGVSFGQSVFTADKRLIVAGGATDGGAKKAAWLEINPVSGALMRTELLTVAGLNDVTASCLAATADGGFVLGGNGTDAVGKKWNVIIKTDQNGKNN